jgi:hypothetical protein
VIFIYFRGCDWLIQKKNWVIIVYFRGLQLVDSEGQKNKNSMIFVIAEILIG